MDARKERFGERDLKKLFAGAGGLLVAKGKKLTRFDMKNAPPGSAELAKAVLGPSGNLRAPTIQVGKNFVVGFSDEAWEEILG